jgi:hypothetical protein
MPTTGHRQVQRWNLPEGWVISNHPAHAALVSEADFIAAQEMVAPWGRAGPTVRRYLCQASGSRLRGPGLAGEPAGHEGDHR